MDADPARASPISPFHLFRRSDPVSLFLSLFVPCLPSLLCARLAQLLHVGLHDGSAPYAKYMRELTFTLENLDLLFKGP